MANELSFTGHLDELRERLFKCFFSVLIGSLLFYLFIDSVLAIIVRPIGKIVFTAPAEAFMARINLSIFGGIIVSMPIILYQIWQFVAAGLKGHERRHVATFGPVSLLCFLTGALFAYFIMIPISLRFLMGFSTPYMVPMITINKYVGFVGSFILAFGIIFELPLIMLFLTKIGIATPEFLIQKRKHAIVLVLVTSAFLTPPDIITLLLMAAPLIILYETGVFVSKLAYRVKEA